MSKLTDRAAYLLGLAKGMNLDAEKDENKLLLETLKLIEELANEVSELDSDIEELNNYAEDLDKDLGEAEAYVYGEDDCCDCGCEDCEECHAEEEAPEQPEAEESCCCECDEKGHVHFECPNCGKPVSLDVDALDEEKDLVCEFCGKPFFTEFSDGEEKKDKKKKKHKK